MNKRIGEIKEVLEKLYAKYNHREFIRSDPLGFVYRYSGREDMEIAGFLSAALAYGRVGQIEKSLDNLFGSMGQSPYAFVKDFNKTSREKLKGFKHRFNTGGDISDLLEGLRSIFDRYGSIEAGFTAGYRETEANVIGALGAFRELLIDICSRGGRRQLSHGVKYLLASPAGGSACKRWNLFLRWMVRSDEVDVGLWETVDKKKLIVPVDVHMGRLCRVLGFYEGKSVSLSAALRITESFREIEPADPVKYDFSLSRIGILENCTGRHRADCEFCELFRFCMQRESSNK